MELKTMFKDKKVILLGVGVSNMPLAGMLSDMGAHLEVRDKKTLEQLGEKGETLLKMGAELVLGEDYLSPMRADYIFRSPGFRPDMPVLREAVENGAVLTSEMELFLEMSPAPVIGVTGSDGKSTTTTIISKILAQAGKKTFLGGNIGEPLLHRIGEMDENSVVAAELSSFQLMTVRAPVTVAVIKNVTPNHLNWHTGMEEYIEAKANILKGCKTAVLNYDDEVCRKLGEECLSPVIWFSRKPIPADFLRRYKGGVYDKNGVITHYDTVTDKETEFLDRKDIILPGDHNAENYSTAIAATLDFADAETVRDVAKTFGGVQHRFEVVRKLDGVVYYNSSIDSSPTRTAAAISSLKCPVRIICGGYDKNIPFEPLADALINHGNIKTVVLTGATAEKIKKAITEHKGYKASGIELLQKDDFTEAVLAASRAAQPGDAVLLSPACASFDAFENFEKRGERFREIINSL